MNLKEHENNVDRWSKIDAERVYDLLHSAAWYSEVKINGQLSHGNRILPNISLKNEDPPRAAELIKRHFATKRSNWGSAGIHTEFGDHTAIKHKIYLMAGYEGLFLPYSWTILYWAIPYAQLREP